MRWLLSGKVMPGGPIAVLTHRGRHSGRTYRSPVEAIVDDQERSEIVVIPARGGQSDWYRNIVAGGLGEVRLRGKSFTAGWRELSESESVEALNRYIGTHPRWARSIIRSLVRHHDLSGDPLPAVAKALPVLGLKLAASEPESGAPGRN